MLTLLRKQSKTTQMDRFDLEQTLIVASVLLLSSITFRRSLWNLLETQASRWRQRSLVAEPNENPPVVSQLCIYPVKSLRAVSLSKVSIDGMGFVGDRRFMVAFPSPPPLVGPHLVTHRFLTQRQSPTLATIDASLVDSRTLKLSSGKESVLVTRTRSMNPRKFKTRIWEDVVDVLDMGDDAAAFLAKVVTSEWKNGVRLVEIASKRLADDRYAPPEARTWLGAAPRVSLTDGFPVLIACQASLDELNRRLKKNGKKPIPMSRFRPNLIIRNTTKPFEEDTWKVIRIGSTIFHLVKGCPRCKQSCTDQRTGQVTKEPLLTLAEFRALGHNGEDVYFAQNAVAQGTSVSVGQTVEVLKRGSPVWDKESVAAE